MIFWVVTRRREVALQIKADLQELASEIKIQVFTEERDFMDAACEDDLPFLIITDGTINASAGNYATSYCEEIRHFARDHDVIHIAFGPFGYCPWLLKVKIKLLLLILKNRI